jgi:hypothetical protein
MQPVPTRLQRCVRSHTRAPSVEGATVIVDPRPCWQPRVDTSTLVPRPRISFPPQAARGRAEPLAPQTHAHVSMAVSSGFAAPAHSSLAPPASVRSQCMPSSPPAVATHKETMGGREGQKGYRCGVLEPLGPFGVPLACSRPRSTALAPGRVRFGCRSYVHRVMDSAVSRSMIANVVVH